MKTRTSIVLVALVLVGMCTYVLAMGGGAYENHPNICKKLRGIGHLYTCPKYHVYRCKCRKGYVWSYKNHKCVKKKETKKCHKTCVKGHFKKVRRTHTLCMTGPCVHSIYLQKMLFISDLSTSPWNGYGCGWIQHRRTPYH